MKIGIIGLAGAGKDTFASMLVQHLQGFSIDRYARPLKELTAKVYGCTMLDIEDRVFKEKPQQVSRDLMIQEVFDCLSNVLKFDDEQMDKASELFFEYFSSARAMSPREFQQLLGTDVVRAVKPTAWVDRLQALDTDLIVPDVRFANEVCDYNILIIRGGDITRPEHSSEHFAWDLQYKAGISTLADVVIGNYYTTSLAQLDNFAQAIAQSITTKQGA